MVVEGEVRTLRLPNLTRDPAGSPDLSAERIEALKGGGIATVSSPSTDLRYRVVVPQGRRFTVAYALPLEDVEGAVRRLRLLGALAVGSVMAVLGLVTFWVLRLGVRPVKSMTVTAAALGSGDLSQRIPESVPGTEAGDLGVALNAMLGRVETAFDTQSRSEDRLRQFVADASHELRTPVTTIRGYAELYRTGGLAEPEALDDAMRRTEQEAIRMGSLVEDLLGLARLDAGRPMRHDPVDLAAIVRDAGLDAGAVEPDRRIVVDAPEEATVSGDEALIRQAVANLMANARLHTPTSSAIRLAARVESDVVIVDVADDGPGMAPEAAERAFERFFRSDPGRGRASGGSGLGLAIVASVMAAHGGTANLTSSPGAGTVVQLTWPLPHPA